MRQKREEKMREEKKFVESRIPRDDKGKGRKKNHWKGQGTNGKGESETSPLSVRRKGGLDDGHRGNTRNPSL